MEVALRIEAFVAFSLTVAAQPFEFAAKQDRLWRDRLVTVRVDETGFSAGQMKWSWDDIQQLTLGRSELRLLGYADSKWRAGRDREWTFEHLPEGTAERLYPVLASKLDRRLVTAMAMTVGAPLWELPVKLQSGVGGSEGTLIANADLVVYRTSDRNQSRTWRILKDIDNVSSAGPFDLVVTTYERRGLLRGGPSEFRFQLKLPLAEERYEALWRRLQKSKGLEILQSYKGVQPR
jgi:hypothetical protein